MLTGKRIASIILCFALLFSIIPLQAMAGSSENSLGKSNLATPLGLSFSQAEFGREGTIEDYDYIYYIANMGTDQPEEIPEGYTTMGYYQSVVDQELGADPGTGKTWGIDHSVNPTVSSASRGPGLAQSLRYVPGADISYDKNTTGIYYDFELPNGTYEVIVGFRNPWNGRPVDIHIEDTLVEDQLQINQNQTIEKIYYTTVSDGELTVSIRNRTREHQHVDPLANYIIVKGFDQYNVAFLQKAIQEFSLTAEEKELYSTRTIRRLEVALQEATDFLEDTTDPTPQQIRDKYLQLKERFDALEKRGIPVWYDQVPVGQEWKDNEGMHIQAHGGGFIEHDGKYWWVGEDKSHHGASLYAVALYSSTDLKNWTYENAIVTTETHPNLKECKIERPKLLYNESTGKFVMWGHWETPHDYSSSCVVVAVSDTIDGDYEYIDHFRPGEGQNITDENGDPQIHPGYPSRDFTVYQDKNTGKAYLFSADSSDMRVTPLTDDYTDVVIEDSYLLFPGEGREAPAVVQVGEYFFVFTSGQSGWMPNQLKYAYTTDIADPDSWSALEMTGNNTSFYSQPTYVMTLTSTSGHEQYIYMGDRWERTALGNSNYVWLPLDISIDGDTPHAELQFVPEWSFDVDTGEIDASEAVVLVSENKPSSSDTAHKDENTKEKANDGYYYQPNRHGGAPHYFAPVSVPFQWTVDLEEPLPLARIDISFNQHNGSEAYHQYSIEASNDQQHWTQLVDESDNKMTGFKSNTLAGVFRYVRISVSGAYNTHNNNSASWAAGLVEVQVYAHDEDPGTTPTDSGLIAVQPFALKNRTAANNMRLQWNPVLGANNYQVLYRAVGEGYSPLGKTQTCSYQQYEVTVGKEYQYKVEALFDDRVLQTMESAVVTAEMLSDDLQLFSNDTAPEGEPVEALHRKNQVLKVGDIYYRFDYQDRGGDGADRRQFERIVMRTSTDGYNFSGEDIVLERSDAPELEDAKLESINYTYNPYKNLFVMWAHFENRSDYTLARMASASGAPGERFTYHGSVRPFGNESRDLTLYTEGEKAYAISSAEVNATMILYELDEDWTSVKRQVARLFEQQWREAPSLIKHQGKYYLFTSRASGWYPSQSKYSVATALEGPWSPLKDFANTSTFSSQSGGVGAFSSAQGQRFYMQSNRWRGGWEDAVPANHQTRILPISFANGSAFTDFYPQVLYNDTNGELVPVQNGKLLSEGKPATASHNPEQAYLANDGDYTTEWNSGESFPAEWTVDLEEIYQLSDVQISWYNLNGSEGYFHYEISGSTDGVTFTTLSDRTEGYTDYGFTYDEISGEARYIKVSLLGCTRSWYGPRFYEVKVHGTETNAVSDLADLYQRYKDHTNPNLYTEESWTVFKAALAQAKAVLEDNDATMTQHLQAYTALYRGIDGLRLLPEIDTSALETLYNRYRQQTNNNYTDSSWQNFQQALATAKRVLNDDNATQKEVTNAAQQLTETFLALEKKKEPETPTPEKPTPGRPSTGSKEEWTPPFTKGKVSVDSSSSRPASILGTVTIEQAKELGTKAGKIAADRGEARALVSLTNVSALTPEALRAMETAAGVPVTLQVQQRSPDGKKVQLQITLPTEGITEPILLGAPDVLTRSQALKAFFQRWFTNTLEAVAWGTSQELKESVRIAVAVDTTEISTENLVIYGYNSAENRYRQLTDTEYRIDDNGYLHFTTDYLTDFIFSKETLQSKSKKT